LSALARALLTALFPGALGEGDQAAITESLSGLESLDSVRELRAAGEALHELGYTFEAS
jgi:hypothetical protein